MFSKTHKDKGQMSEGEVSELCPRIFELGTEFNKQSEDVKNRCFLETLLKGSFSLPSFYDNFDTEKGIINEELKMQLFEIIKAIEF